MPKIYDNIENHFAKGLNETLQVSNGTDLPLLPDIKKPPKLRVLDTGMLNYFVGIQKEILGTQDLNSIYQGTMIEHFTGQEMLAFQHQALSSLYFWVREEKIHRPRWIIYLCTKEN